MIASMRLHNFIIHEHAHARAALQAAVAADAQIGLWSAPGAALYAGAGWFDAMIHRAAKETPEARFIAVLDCADRADLAQAALRQGLTQICYRGTPAVARRLSDIARQYGATLHRKMPLALDLLHVDDPLAACRAWLGGD
jgi:hypothetical protein